MRRVAFAILVLLMTFSTGAAVKVIAIKHVATGGGTFCSGSFDLCDEFTQTAAPPTGWTEQGTSTTWETNGTQLRGPTGGSDGMAILYSTQTSSADQYGIIQLAVNDFNTGLFLRSNGDDSGYADMIYIWSDGGTPVIGWSDAFWFGGWVDDIATCEHTMASGDYLMTLVTGTGTARTASIWVTSTMPTAPPTTGADCVFTSGTGCTGTNCNCINTDCVPQQSTLGRYAGVWAYDAATRRTYDNFAAGSP